MPLILLIIFITVIGVLLTLAGGAGFLFFAILVDIFLIFTGVRIVRPNEVRTVEFLGKYNRILRQGLNFIIPIIETTRYQSLFKETFSVDVEGVTHDNVTAYIGLNVIYFVEDDGNDTVSGNIYRSVYSIDDHRTMMKATIDEQLRSMIVNFTHKEIFGKREEIGNEIEEKLREKLSSFGYRLDSIQVKDVKLDMSVMAAMNKVVESEKLKEAAFNEGEANKIKMVKQAEADKEAKILVGEGMAGQRMKIAEGFKESVDMIQQADDTLTAKDVLQFLLDSSRIETLSEIGQNSGSKLIYLNENLEGKGFYGSKMISSSNIVDYKA